MGFTNYPNGVTSFGVPLFGDGAVPFIGGDTYWVKKATDSDYADFKRKYNVVYKNSGYNSVQPTADLAFAAAQKNDRIIFMAPDSGGHDLTETITIDQFGLKVFGCSNSYLTQRVTLKLPTTATDVDMFVIKADKVEIAGLTFQNRKAGSCITIGDTAGQAYYQIHIHDCNLTDYGSVATYGITPGPVAAAANDQADLVNLVVENCCFADFQTAAIQVNGTRSSYVNNIFQVAATAKGLNLYSSTDSRSKVLIKDNFFFGPADATTIGITAANIDHAVCWANILDNKCVGFTAATQPIIQFTNLQGGGNMYAAAATGTWTAIDIVA